MRAKKNSVFFLQKQNDDIFFVLLKKFLLFVVVVFIVARRIADDANASIDRIVRPTKSFYCYSYTQFYEKTDPIICGSDVLRFERERERERVREKY